ncbi:hypothetical protein PDO_1179 [Rhizobium sp. PDO1-076]|nr:hypothetical protein PDO_1179 [Rhizobium sp. PDO1-076]
MNDVAELRSRRPFAAGLRSDQVNRVRVGRTLVSQRDNRVMVGVDTLACLWTKAFRLTRRKAFSLYWPLNLCRSVRPLCPDLSMLALMRHGIRADVAAARHRHNCQHDQIEPSVFVASPASVALGRFAGLPSLVWHMALSLLMVTTGPDMTGPSSAIGPSPFATSLAPAHHVGHGVHVPIEVRPRPMCAADFFAHVMTKAGAPGQGVRPLGSLSKEVASSLLCENRETSFNASSLVGYEKLRKNAKSPPRTCHSDRACSMPPGNSHSLSRFFGQFSADAGLLVRTGTKANKAMSPWSCRDGRSHLPDC